MYAKPFPKNAFDVAHQERFWAKVKKSDGGCWEWLAKRDRSGYGRFHVLIEGSWKGFAAHRLLYEHLIGDIPRGLITDHLCRNRGCVNPAHVEIVTDQINTIRGYRARDTGYCRNGHRRTPENTYTYKKTGIKICRACHSRSTKKGNYIHES